MWEFESPLPHLEVNVLRLPLFIVKFVETTVMKNKYMAILAALLLPVLVGFAPDWVKFTSEKGAFSVQLPGQPEESEQAVKTDIGELSLRIFSYETDKNDVDNNIVYMIMSTDYPESSGISSDAKERIPTMFRNAVDGGVKNVNGKLLSEKDITLKGFPGRQYKLAFQEGEGIISGRFYLVKNRMYMVQAIVMKAKENDPSVLKFLNSFSVL